MASRTATASVIASRAARARVLGPQMLGPLLVGERQIPRTDQPPDRLIVRGSTGPAATRTVQHQPATKDAS